MPWNCPVFDSTGKIKDARLNTNTLTASGSPSIGAASSSGSATEGSGPGIPDVTLLTVNDINDTTMTQRDTVAYAALNLESESAGFTFNDPATGLLTCKITDETFPPEAASDRSWTHAYSGEGLQISAAWGPDGDMFTIAVQDPVSADTQLIDYQLGGTVSNARSLPYSESRFSFLRSAGNEQIVVGANGNTLERYNTATDSVENTGNFPYSWTIRSGPAWFNISGDETYCTAVLNQGSSVTAIELATGTVTNRNIAGIDELYCMASDKAVISGSTDGVWDITNDTFTSVSLQGNGVFHAIANYNYNNGSPIDDFVIHFDINTDNVYHTFRINPDATLEADVVLRPYIAGMHSSGYACKGTNNLWRMAVLGQYGAQIVSTDGYDQSIFLFDAYNGDKYEIGHSYALWQSGTDLGGGAGSQNYYDQPKPHIQQEGYFVIYTTNYNSNNRYDVFLIELPRS